MVYNTIVDVLYQIERFGFFDYVLPFLLVFAIIYGILSYMKIFEKNKGVSVIVALIFGLLSIRLPFYSMFLTELSPRLGVGVVVLLTILILIGLFTPEKQRGTMGWILTGVGVIIFLVIGAQLMDIFSFWGYSGLSSNEIIAWVVMIGLLIAIIIGVVVSQSSGDKDLKLKPLFASD